MHLDMKSLKKEKKKKKLIESQKRLSGLAILLIENEMLEELENKNLISQFASQKARKIFLNEIYYNIKILNKH